MSECKAFPVRWFLGIAFTPMSVPEAASRIVGRDPGAPFCYVTTPNAQHVVAVHRGSAVFTAAHDGAWMVLNDSRILSLLADRLFGLPMALAAGSDLSAHLFAHDIRPDDPLTIIGGSDEVERRLRADFGIRALARFAPPMGFYNDPAEIERCVDFILAHPARYVFLRRRCPAVGNRGVARHRPRRRDGRRPVRRQLAPFRDRVVKRAPALIRRMHLEAAYRLLQNPRRHAKRVFVESLPVLWIGVRTRLTQAAPRPHRRRPPR